MKKIVILGSSSAIAQEFIRQLSADVQILKLAHTVKDDSTIFLDINNISDEVFLAIKEFKADTLINFAWLSVTSTTYNKNEHLDNFIGAVTLIKHFIENGGQNVIGIGTFLEYGGSYHEKPLIETDINNPSTFYAQVRANLCTTLEMICKHYNVNFTWARIFSNYGIETNPARLTNYIISNLNNNKSIFLNTPHNISDFIYYKDVANSLIKIAEIDQYNGIVNICTGQGTSVLNFAQTIAKFLGKEDLITFNQENKSSQIQFIGNNSKLKKIINYDEFYSVQDGVKDLLKDLKLYQ